MLNSVVASSENYEVLDAAQALIQSQSGREAKERDSNAALAGLGFAALTWNPVATFSREELLPGSVTPTQKELAVSHLCPLYASRRREDADFHLLLAERRWAPHRRYASQPSGLRASPPFSRLFILSHLVLSIYSLLYDTLSLCFPSYLPFLQSHLGLRPLMTQERIWRVSSLHRLHYLRSKVVKTTMIKLVLVVSSQHDFTEQSATGPGTIVHPTYPVCQIPRSPPKPKPFCSFPLPDSFPFHPSSGP